MASPSYLNSNDMVKRIMHVRLFLIMTSVWGFHQSTLNHSLRYEPLALQSLGCSYYFDWTPRQQVLFCLFVFKPDENHLTKSETSVVSTVLTAILKQYYPRGCSRRGSHHWSALMTLKNIRGSTDWVQFICGFKIRLIYWWLKTGVYWSLWCYCSWMHTFFFQRMHDQLGDSSTAGCCSYF